MRGTLAKRIRRAAREATVGNKDVDYQVRFFGTDGRYTATLTEGTTRHLYQRLKRSRRDNVRRGVCWEHTVAGQSYRAYQA